MCGNESAVTGAAPVSVKLPFVCRSVKPAGDSLIDANRSFRVGARMSRDRVPRKRSSSFRCQSMPTFQVVALPLVV